MVLLIDDVRNFNADIIARTVEAAIRILMLVQDVWPFETICIDFDMGVGTGLDVLKWTAPKGVLTKTKHVQLITMNPVGRKQMGDYLKDFGYTSEDGFNFFLS